MGMERLGRQLWLTWKLAHDGLEQQLADAGGSISRWVVLKVVAHEPGLSHRDLATGMGLARPTLTHHLDRMEADGLIARTRDTVDRRIVRVSLTPDGKQRLTELEAVVDTFDRELRALLPEREVASLQRSLTRLYDRLADGGPTRAR